MEQTKKKKVLITGGYGFIGLALAARILEKDFTTSVLLFGHQPKVDEVELMTLQRRFPTRLICEDGDIAEGDLDINTFTDIDEVYHLAARKVTTKSIDAGDLLGENLMIDEAVVYAYEDRPEVKIVYLSTGEVFGPSWEIMAQTPETWPVHESRDLVAVDTSNIKSLYALSKIVGEMRFKFQPRNKFRWSIVRLQNPYGPRMGDDTLIPSLMRNKGMQNVNINDTRPFIYIDDVCDGLMLVMASEYTNGKVVHLAGAEQVVGDVADMISRLCYDGELKYVSMVRHAFALNHRRALDTKTLRELGWRQWIDMDEGIRRTWDYYKTRFSI